VNYINPDGGYCCCSNYWITRRHRTNRRQVPPLNQLFKQSKTPYTDLSCQIRCGKKMHKTKKLKHLNQKWNESFAVNITNDTNLVITLLWKGSPYSATSLNLASNPPKNTPISLPLARGDGEKKGKLVLLLDFSQSKQKATKTNVSKVSKSDVNKRIAAGKKSGTWGLNLNHCGLTSFPSKAREYEMWRVIDCSSNNFKSWPDFGTFLHLSELNLAGNAIVQVADSISYLANLQILNLTGNRVQSISEGIGKLVRLEKLQLMNNNLSSLPKSIGALTQLQGEYF